MRGRMVGSLGALRAMALTSVAFAQEPASPSSARFDATPPAPSAAAPVEPPPPQAGGSSLTTPLPGELPPTSDADTSDADVADNSGKPSSGLGMIIPGWILTGTGVVGVTYGARAQVDQAHRRRSQR
jgi:hypothetical protein